MKSLVALLPKNVTSLYEKMTFRVYGEKDGCPKAKKTDWVAILNSPPVVLKFLEQLGHAARSDTFDVWSGANVHHDKSLADTNGEGPVVKLHFFWNEDKRRMVHLITIDNPYCQTYIEQLRKDFDDLGFRSAKEGASARRFASKDCKQLGAPPRYLAFGSPGTGAFHLVEATKMSPAEAKLLEIGNKIRVTKEEAIKEVCQHLAAKATARGRKETAERSRPAARASKGQPEVDISRRNEEESWLMNNCEPYCRVFTGPPPFQADSLVTVVGSSYGFHSDTKGKPFNHDDTRHNCTADNMMVVTHCLLFKKDEAKEAAMSEDAAMAKDDSCDSESVAAVLKYRETATGGQPRDLKYLGFLYSSGAERNGSNGPCYEFVAPRKGVKGAEMRGTSHVHLQLPGSQGTIEHLVKPCTNHVRLVASERTVWPTQETRQMQVESLKRVLPQVSSVSVVGTCEYKHIGAISSLSEGKSLDACVASNDQQPVQAEKTFSVSSSEPSRLHMLPPHEYQSSPDSHSFLPRESFAKSKCAVLSDAHSSGMSLLSSVTQVVLLTASGKSIDVVSSSDSSQLIRAGLATKNGRLRVPGTIEDTVAVDSASGIEVAKRYKEVTSDSHNIIHLRRSGKNDHTIFSAILERLEFQRSGKVPECGYSPVNVHSKGGALVKPAGGGLASVADKHKWGKATGVYTVSGAQAAHDRMEKMSRAEAVVQLWYDCRNGRSIFVGHYVVQGSVNNKRPELTKEVDGQNEGRSLEERISARIEKAEKDALKNNIDAINKELLKLHHMDKNLFESDRMSAEDERYAVHTTAGAVSYTLVPFESVYETYTDKPFRHNEKDEDRTKGKEWTVEARTESSLLPPSLPVPEDQIAIVTSGDKALNGVATETPLTDRQLSARLGTAWHTSSSDDAIAKCDIAQFDLDDLIQVFLHASFVELLRASDSNTVVIPDKGDTYVIPARPDERPGGPSRDTVDNMNLGSLLASKGHPTCVPQDPSAMLAQHATNSFHENLCEFEVKGAKVVWKHRAGRSFLQTTEAFDLFFKCFLTMVPHPTAVFWVAQEAKEKGFSWNKTMVPSPSDVEEYTSILRTIKNFESRFFHPIFEKFCTADEFSKLLIVLAKNGEETLHEASKKESRKDSMHHIREELNGWSHAIFNDFQVHQVMRGYECAVHDPFGDIDQVPTKTGGIDGAKIAKAAVKSSVLTNVPKDAVKHLNQWARENIGDPQACVADKLKVMGLFWDATMKKLRHVVGIQKPLDASDTEHLMCCLSVLTQNTTPQYNCSTVRPKIHQKRSHPIRHPDPTKKTADTEVLKHFTKMFRQSEQSYYKLVKEKKIGQLPSFLVRKTESQDKNDADDDDAGFPPLSEEETEPQNRKRRRNHHGRGKSTTRAPGDVEASTREAKSPKKRQKNNVTTVV